MEYESQLAILNACGLFLGSSADISFIDGDYGSAFHYFRRQGFSEGAIYCYEYGIGTPPLAKHVDMGVKRCRVVTRRF